MTKNSTLDTFDNNSKSQTQSKILIYYTFPGQGRCKLVRMKKNEPFFKLYIPKSSMSKTFSSDIYRDGKLISSLGNTCQLLKCVEKEEKGLEIDWCILKESAAVKNLTNDELELLKKKIKENQPKDFGSGSISILYENNGKRYMLRGLRESLKSDSKDYIFTIRLSDNLETQGDNISHKDPTIHNDHYHNRPRYEIDDKIMKQSDLPNCINLNTWVYKEYMGGFGL